MTKVHEILEEYKLFPPTGHNYPVLTLTEKNGFVHQSDRFNKRLATEDTSKYKVISMEDIAFNPYLLWAGAIAQNTIVNKGIISPLYPTFRVKEGYHPRYVAMLLLSPTVIKMYDNIAFGSVPRRRRTSIKDFLSLTIPTPPSYEEQKRIVAILDKAKSIQEARERQLAALDELSYSIFIDSFGSPNEWSKKYLMTTIGDIAVSTQYGTSAKSGDTGKYPVLRMGNITDHGHLDLTDLKYQDIKESEIPKYTVAINDMLFNRTNSKEKVGKSAVIRTDIPLAYAGYLIRVRYKNPRYAEFVATYLNSTYGKSLRQKMAKSAVNQANINATELKNISIPNIPKEALSNFSHKINKIDNFQNFIHKTLKENEVLYNSLQYSLYNSTGGNNTN